MVGVQALVVAENELCHCPARKVCTAWVWVGVKVLALGWLGGFDILALCGCGAFLADEGCDCSSQQCAACQKVCLAATKLPLLRSGSVACVWCLCCSSAEAAACKLYRHGRAWILLCVCKVRVNSVLPCRRGHVCGCKLAPHAPPSSTK